MLQDFQINNKVVLHNFYLFVCNLKEDLETKITVYFWHKSHQELLLQRGAGIRGVILDKHFAVVVMSTISAWWIISSVVYFSRVLSTAGNSVCTPTGYWLLSSQPPTTYHSSHCLPPLLSSCLLLFSVSDLS